MVLIFLVMKLFQKGTMFNWVTVSLSHEMLHHAMVSEMSDDLSVQPPPPPGKLAAQLKSPFGDSCLPYFHYMQHLSQDVCWCSRWERGVLGAKFLQQKFQFEISLIPHAQWNGTFQLHRPDPSHSMLFNVLVNKSRIQKSSTRDNNFVKWRGTFCSNRPKWPDQSKWTTFKAGHEDSGQTKPKWTFPLIWSTNWNFWNFGLIGNKAPLDSSL